MAKYGLGSISSTFIPYGHQVCKNADGDGPKEVCTIQHIYHKVEREEHAIDVDSLSFCILFTEDYKMKKVLGVGPNVYWQKAVHGYTYKYCVVCVCDGQREGETVIWEFGSWFMLWWRERRIKNHISRDGFVLHYEY